MPAQFITEETSKPSGGGKATFFDAPVPKAQASSGEPSTDSSWGGLEAVVPLAEAGKEGLKSAAALPWKQIVNVSENIFPLPQKLTDYAKEQLAVLASNYQPQTTPEKIVHGTVKGAAEIPEYALGFAAGGVPGIAVVAGTEELDKGVLPAAKAAVGAVALGKAQQALAPFTRSVQATTLAGLNAGITAAQGGGTSDVTASAMIGAGLSVAGPAGKREITDLIPEREVQRNPAEAIRALRRKEIADAIDQKGPQGNVRDDQGIRGQEGQAGVLREREQGQDQGRPQEAQVIKPRLRAKTESVDSARPFIEALKVEGPVRNPLGHPQGGAIDIEPLAVVTDRAVQAIKPSLEDLGRDLGLKVSPISVGSRETAGAAKVVANMSRAINWERNETVGILTKSFKPAEWKEMWNRLSEEAVARQNKTNTEGKGLGLDALNDKQKQVVLELQERSAQAAAEAVKLGLLKDPMEIYDPRKVVEILPDGTRRKITGMGARSTSPMAGGLSISSSHLKERKYLTAEETEVAAKRKFSGEKEVELLRDIRVLPIVTAELERAVLGKKLINEIKLYGKQGGFEMDPVTSDSQRPGYFTIPENRAFYEYKYAGQNPDGTPRIERQPIYVHKDFEGPLRAVLQGLNPGTAYRALMGLKNASASMIMASPLVHNSVIWAKALPFMPGKVASLSAYVEGHRLRSSPGFNRQATEDGLVFVDSRQYQDEVVGGLPSDIGVLEPGRGLLSKGAGGLVGIVNPAAGRAVKQAIDNAGAFWHQTLLWNRIGDLQGSIYNTVRDDLMNRGINPTVAGPVAAHFANRFGGAIPREELSAMANKIANVSLFSKSFTGTNLGLYFDAIRGLPKSTRGVIERNANELESKTANNYVRKRAVGTLLKDVAFLFGVNALAQDVLNILRGDKTLDQVSRDYAYRWYRFMTRANEHPSEVLNRPIDSIVKLFPQGENEPGKEMRVRIGTEKSGQALYGKLAVGKTAEDLINVTNPGVMLHNKLSGLAQFATHAYNNQDAFGKRIYDPQAKGWGGTLDNVASLSKAFLQAQVPTDWLAAVYERTQGEDQRKVTQLRAVLPALGVSVSRGSPKGPAGGEVVKVLQERQFKVQQATKQVLDLIDQGKQQQAIKTAIDAGMTAQEVHMLMKYRNQFGKSTMRRFFQNATPEEIEDFYRLQR